MTEMKIEAKDVFNMTWNYFQQHAQQRIAYFNYFVVFQVCMTTGLLATFKPEFEAYFMGVGIGLLQILISFVFWKIDERNKFLTKHGESALIEFEKKYPFLKYDNSNPSPIFLFSSEEVHTKRLREAQNEKRIWKRQMSHSKCCNLMFIIFAIIGVFGASCSVFYSTRCYMNRHKTLEEKTPICCNYKINSHVNSELDSWPEEGNVSGKKQP